MNLLKIEHKRLLSNFLSLSSLNVVNLVLPLLIMPYLIKTLGLFNYGILVFSQAIISYCDEFVNFGFRYSAVRDISINRDSHDKIKKIYSSVILSKLLLASISFFILLILILYIPKFNEHYIVISLSFLTILGNVFFPEWFFLGVEKAKSIAYVTVISKIILLATIYIFVKESSDLNIAALLFSLSYIIPGLLGTLIIYKKFNIRITKVSYIDIKQMLTDSYSFFLARISSTIYNSTNPLIIGFMIGNEALAIYNVVEKIYFCIIRAYQAISNTLYPYISNTRNIVLHFKISLIFMVIHIIAIICIYYMSFFILNIFLNDVSLQEKWLLLIFLITSFFTLYSILNTYPLLAALGYKSQANRTSITGVILYLFIVSILYIFEFISLYSLSLTLLSVEAIVSLNILYYAYTLIYRNGLKQNE